MTKISRSAVMSRMMIRNTIYRYLLYFLIFISLVQILGHSQVQAWLASYGGKFNIELIGTYAPLFLSILLIDVTYQIGKRQNAIADHQNRIERHRMYKELYSLVVQVERETDQLISEVFQIFLCINQKESKQDISHQQSKITSCLNKIKESEVDFHILQFSQSDKLYVKIEELVQSAATIINIVSVLNDLYANKIAELKYPQREDIIEINDPNTDKFTRNIIAKMVELNEMSPMHLVDSIDKFLAKRNELFGSDNNILSLIKDESYVDYHA